MQIAIVCEAVFPESKGGLERWMVWLATNLHRRGYSVSYLNASGVDEVRDGINFKSVTKASWSYSKKGTRSISKSLNFGIKLYSHIKKMDYEVLYAAQAPVVSLLFIASSKIRSKNSLLVVEWLEIWPQSYWREYLGNILGSFGYLIQRLTLSVGDVKVCFTDRVYSKLLYTRSHNRIFKLPGICMENNTGFPLKFKERNDIIFLSRFVEEKNPLLAIDAVVEYRKLGWLGFFFVIGSGPMESEIKDYIELKNASSFVKLFTNIPDSKVLELMKSSFVLLHTSSREGFGLSMIEAACQGVPTILINYSENISVDLAIIKDLISQTATTNEILIKLQEANINQRLYFEKLKTWFNEIYPGMLGIKSIDEIENIIVDNLKLNCKQKRYGE
jgi:glycosyltransferase involved in cell wall biosynthesis